MHRKLRMPWTVLKRDSIKEFPHKDLSTISLGDTKCGYISEAFEGLSALEADHDQRRQKEKEWHISY